MGRRPRRGHPEDTALRLTVAAARMFEEHGYFATDSNAIARAAGYAPGTFYKHFRDKTDAFVAVYTWWVENVWAEVDASWSAPLEREDRARTAIAHVVRVHAAWPRFRRDLRHLAESDPRVQKAFTENRRAQLARLVAMAGKPRRASCFGLLLAIERTADAIAMGEASRMGISPEVLEAELVTAVRALLAP
ncbi:TetR/AcrR family transcriptional regulator [Pendulispora brunnea]|uniref:TetR/AcrR family transcriptional regulator n=1 Tax=Pendulispora brunnea TaxID=2905690 RepID=A0ABZ2JV85_9BACT